MANGLSGLAAKIGGGLVAAAVGTAAMTAWSTWEQKRRGRAASTAPADAAAKVLGIEGFCDDAAENRFSNVVHWAYGAAWGVPARSSTRRASGPSRRPPRMASRCGAPS